MGALPLNLRRNGFFPILIVILLLISKNLSRARLRLRLRLRACQCGPAAGLNSMAVLPYPLPTPPSWGEGIDRRQLVVPRCAGLKTQKRSAYDAPCDNGKSFTRRSANCVEVSARCFWFWPPRARLHTQLDRIGSSSPSR